MLCVATPQNAYVLHPRTLQTLYATTQAEDGAQAGAAFGPGGFVSLRARAGAVQLYGYAQQTARHRQLFAGLEFSAALVAGPLTFLGARSGHLLVFRGAALLRASRPHARAINQICYDEATGAVLTAADDGFVRLAGLRGAAPLQSNAHGLPATGCCFYRGLAVSCGADGRVLALDPAAGLRVARAAALPGVRAVAAAGARLYALAGAALYRLAEGPGGALAAEPLYAHGAPLARLAAAPGAAEVFCADAEQLLAVGPRGGVRALRLPGALALALLPDRFDPARPPLYAANFAKVAGVYAVDTVPRVGAGGRVSTGIYRDGAGVGASAGVDAETGADAGPDDARLRGADWLAGAALREAREAARGGGADANGAERDARLRALLDVARREAGAV